MYQERDYEGDMDFFVNQLEKAGVTKEEFDVTNWVGCTKTELQALTDRAIIMHNAKEVNNVN